MSRRWILTAAILGSGIVFLDSTIVPVALPKIGEDLRSTFLGTLEAQSYIYYGYLLALSALLLLGGALGDFYGRRRFFVIGLAGFGATSVLCGIAPNMEFLVVARILQGAAGAILVPGSLSIITATFEGQEQARAFGVWAGASAVTTILGPVVGGALVAYVSWRAAFWINVPLVAAALWATLRFMPEGRDENATGSFDWLGAMIGTIAIGGLSFGMIRGQAVEWQQATPFVALGLGVAATIAFPFVMARSPAPLVPLELFEARNFTVTNLSTLLIYGAIYVFAQFLALFAIGVLRYNEVGFGVGGLPTVVFLALFSTRFGELAERFGPRLFMTLGPAFMAAGLLWFVRMPADSAPWKLDPSNPSTIVPPASYLGDMLPALVLFGIGLMIMVAPLTAALMRSVPVTHAGVASAINNAVSRVGPQLAGALLFVVISATFYASLAERAPSLDTSSPQIREQVSPLNPPPTELGRDVAAAARIASTNAFRLGMFMSALLCAAGAAVNWFGIRNETARDEREPARPVTPCPQAPPVEAPAHSLTTPAPTRPPP